MTRRSWNTTELVATLRGLAAEGVSKSNAAAKVGVTAPYVGQLAVKFGIEFRHGLSKPDGDRAGRMAQMYRAGSTLEQIGQHYKITRERVRQIITKHFGTSRVDGGQHKQVAGKRAREAATRDAKYLAEYGCSYAGYRALADIGRAMVDGGDSYYRTPIGAYGSQRANAQRRGIEWQLNLQEWWQIWQASGKWSDRGRDGFVMCRHGDLGPYALGNVFIGTSAENASTRKGNSGLLPRGVSLQNGKTYAAKRSIGGKQTHLGTFKTPEEAHAAYLASAPGYLRRRA